MNPRAEEVIVKGALAISITYARTKHVHAEEWLRVG